MSAKLEQHPDRLLVLRVCGELKKSELDAVQSEFVQKIAAAGTVKLLVLLENFWLGTRRGVGRHGLFLQPSQRLSENRDRRQSTLGSTGAGLQGRGSSQGSGEVFSRNRPARGARVARRVSVNGRQPS
jgi:hypothetical protein